MQRWWQLLLGIGLGLSLSVGFVHAQSRATTQATVGFYDDKTTTTIDRDSVQGAIPDGRHPYWQSPKRLAATRNDPPATAKSVTARLAWTATTGRLPQTEETLNWLLMMVGGLLGLVALLAWLIRQTLNKGATKND